MGVSYIGKSLYFECGLRRSWRFYPLDEKLNSEPERETLRFKIQGEKEKANSGIPFCTTSLMSLQRRLIPRRGAELEVRYSFGSVKHQLVRLWFEPLFVSWFDHLFQRYRRLVLASSAEKNRTRVRKHLRTPTTMQTVPGVSSWLTGPRIFASAGKFTDTAGWCYLVAKKSRKTSCTGHQSPRSRCGVGDEVQWCWNLCGIRWCIESTTA